MKILLEHGADVNIANKKGHTPLYVSISRCASDTEASGPNLEKIKLLIEHGANVNSFISPSHHRRGAKPLTYLAYAITRCLPVARLLLEGGADPEAVDGNNKSVMFYAELSQNPEAVQLLQEFIQKRHQEQRVAEEAGKRIEETTGQGCRAITTTVRQFNSEAEGLKPINKIKKAIRENNAAALRSLVMIQNNLALTDETGYTPLMLAAESNRPELVKLLLSLEQDKLAAAKDSKEASELRQAAAKNKEKARVIAEKYGFKDVISLLSGRSISLVPSAQAGTAGSGIGIGND